MTCDNEDCNCDCGTPCSPNVSDESIASQLENLANALFGSFTKTVTNGHAVWTAMCSPYESGVPAFPRASGEGLLCYVIRLMLYIASLVPATSEPTFTQAVHGFAVGQAVRYTGVVWIRAIASAPGTSEVVGIVKTVVDANNFRVCTDGFMTGFIGLVPGQRYFLSAAALGGLTVTEPLAIGTVSKPVMIAVTATMGNVQILRGINN